MTDANSKIPLTILSNLPNLDRVETDRFVVLHRFIGQEGSAWSGVRLFFQAFRADVLILSNDTPRLFVFCLLACVVPFRRCQLVSLDIVLRRPISWPQRVQARIKRLLLQKVDLFIHYFKDIEGYEKYYGISGRRSAYVPFKVNLPKIPPRDEVSQAGEYVVTIGRSHRDLQTFVLAMRGLNYPGLLLYQNAAIFRKHGTELDLTNLPPNLRAELNEGGPDKYNEFVRRAKLVVLPIVAGCLSAAGISNYLLAMALGRCVIITEGTATRGLLSHQAIVVPPADPDALARAIRSAWEDDEFRERVAEAGWRYAEQRGGEPRLLRDIVDAVGEFLTTKGSNRISRFPKPGLSV
jgi:glycosyltransferase involved in cell wall biosynthesis